eukprot:COSAG02_NODE_364_length_23758_cov_17.250011_5_plen_41_part_00
MRLFLLLCVLLCVVIIFAQILSMRSNLTATNQHYPEVCRS